MPSLLCNDSPSTDRDRRVRVPLKPSLARLFFEPIVLLKALTATCEKKISNDLDLSLDLTKSPEKIFRRFVNTLAHICSSEKGGNMVTFFTVLQHPDHIEYRFTSNQRDNEEFARAQKFTASILDVLGNMQQCDKQSVISDILRRSVSFCRARVMVYIGTLKAQAEQCIKAAKREDTYESRSIHVKLEEIYEQLLPVNEQLSHNEFTKYCESIINSINNLHQSKVYEFICNRTKEGQIDESEKWFELRHVAGRLLSYLLAAKSLVSMPKRWPELFDNPRVYYVSSSVPDGCPFRGKHSPNKLTAHAIIGRMTSNLNMQEEHRAHAEELQRVGLDETVQKQAKKLQPLVHGEVLLLESLVSDGGTHPSRFFNGYKYIGSSKPTCILCWHYFSVHPSGVEVRGTHRNLYPSWRMPDVYGDQAGKVRTDLVNDVLSRIRKDAFRVLKEKLAEGKRHDSNTSSSYIRDNASNASMLTMDALTLIDSDDEERSSVTEPSSLDESETSSDVDCGEDGGVKLF